MVMKTKTDLQQHFLTDKAIINTMIKFAKVKKSDVVLEIGPGTGNITSEIAKSAKKVIAVEIDQDFKPSLEAMPENVQVIFEDILDYLKRSGEFNKIISNLPFNLCEPLFRYLISAENVELSILITPVSFAEKASINPVFSSFLKIEEIGKISKKSFSPVPRTDSEIIKVTRTKSNKKKVDVLIKKALYKQKDKKIKNGLVWLMTSREVFERKLTKKEAKEEIKKMEIPERLLDKKIANLPLGFYEKISKYFTDKEIWA